MFKGAKRFNQDIGNWKTDQVTDVSFMFAGAAAFNRPITFNQKTGVWETSKFKNVKGMFQGATRYDHAPAFDRPKDFILL